jgi:hypothetical protein
MQKKKITNLHIIDINNNFSSPHLRPKSEEQFASAFKLFFESEEEVQSVEATKSEQDITINFTFRSGAMKLLIITEQAGHVH